MSCIYSGPDGRASKLQSELKENYIKQGHSKEVAEAFSSVEYLTTKTSSFISWFGNWMENPKDYKSQLNTQGEPKVYFNNGLAYFKNAKDSTIRYLNTMREFQDDASGTYKQSFFQKEVLETEDDRAVMALAMDFAERFNQKVIQVDEEEARKINPNYKNQPAFFMNGVAVLVKGKSNRLSAVHEVFGHPFLEFLQKDNPALLAKLYEEAFADAELVRQTRELYPEEVNDDGSFTVTGQKELIIAAIEKDSQGLIEDTSLFRKLLNLFWKQINKILNIGIPLSSKSTIKQVVEFAFYGNASLGTHKGVFDKRSVNTREKIVERIRERYLKYSSEIIDGIETYVNAEFPDKKYERGTEVIQGNFSTLFDIKEQAERKASEKFLKAGFGKYKEDPSIVVTIIGPKKQVFELNYEQTVQYFIKEYNKVRSLGTIKHRIIEGFLKRETVEQIKKAILPMILMKTDSEGNVIQDAIDESEYQWLIQNLTDEHYWNLFVQKLGVNANFNNVFDPYNQKLEIDDDVMTELIVADEDLGIATRIDFLAVNENGEIVNADFKSTNQEQEAGSRILRYMDVNDIQSMANSYNNNSLALALRMLILKKNDPDFRFAKSFLLTITKNGIKDKKDILLQPYLNGLRNWIKETKPMLYESMEQQGLFDEKNYWGSTPNASRIFGDIAKGLEPDQTTTVENMQAAIKVKGDELARIEGQIFILKQSEKSQVNTTRIYNLKQASEKLLIDLIELTNTTINGQKVLSQGQDIKDAIRANLMNVYDVKHPLVQWLLRQIDEAELKHQKEYQSLKRQLDAALEKVKKNTPGFRSVGNLITPGMKYYVGDGTGIYDFALFKDVDGFIKRVTETNNPVRWKQMTQDQKNFALLYDKMLSMLYKEAAFKTSKDHRNSEKTKAAIVGAPVEMPDGFLPLVPMSMAEYSESRDNGHVKKGLLSRLHQNYTNKLLSDPVAFKRPSSFDYQYGGIPLKFTYLPESMMNAGEYSLDMEHIFSLAATNYLDIKHLDNIEAMGRAVITKFENDGRDLADGTAQYKNYIKWVDTQLKMRVFRKTVFDESSIGNFAIGGSAEELAKLKRLDLNGVAQMMRDFTTLSSMYLHPINAGFNGALIGMLNYKHAFVNSIIGKMANKGTGFDKKDLEFIDFQLEDLNKGQKLYFQLKKDILDGKQENNPLWHIIQDYGFLPDSYQGAVRPEDKVFAKNTLGDTATGLIFHTVVEDWGMITLLGAMLNKKKVTVNGKEKSMFEAYDVETTTSEFGGPIKQLRWNGGTRGVITKTENGKVSVVREITGITKEEMRSMMQASSAIHGDYRKSEKANIHGYVLGKMFIQFKNYMLRQMKNMISTKRVNETSGIWEKIVDEKGNPVKATYRKRLPDGTLEEVEETELQWRARVTEGWVWTSAFWMLQWLKLLDNPSVKKLAASMGMDINNKDYMWENLSFDQKRNLINGGITIAASLVAYSLSVLALGADADDDDKLVALKIRRLIEDLYEGGSALDTVRNLSNPFPLLTTMKTLIDNGGTFIISAATGDKTAEGYYKGERALIKKIPIASEYYHLQRILNGE